MLLICDGQEDAIIHGDRARKKSGGVRAHNGNVIGIVAQRRASGLCDSSCSITWLKRNAGRLWSAVRRADTRVADEHLPVAAVCAARGSLQLRGSLIRGIARSDGQKRDKAPRSADGRQNAFGSDQCSVHIGGNQMRRRLAGFSRASASIQQVDLPSLRRIFHEVRRSRAESHIASVGAHRGRVVIVVRGSAVGRCGKKSRVRLASSRGTFAGIA